MKTSPQPELTNDEMQRLVLLDTNYTYSEAVAKETAIKLAAQMKDGQSRTISKVLTVPSLYSITGKTDIATDFKISKPKTPSLYVVNFRDAKGFVVVSADKRAPEILATVETSTIDSLAHQGLRIFLDNAVQYMDTKVAATEALRGDAVFNSMVNKLSKALYHEQPVVTDKNPTSGRVANVPCPQTAVHVPGAASTLSTDCGGGNTCLAYVFTTPILTQNAISYISQPKLKTLWGQYAPFNNQQPSGGCNTGNYSCGNGGNNNKYLAGCVPVAEGQVVAYFYSKKDPAWLTITNKNKCDYSSSDIDQVSKLLHAILLAYGSRASSGCVETKVTQPSGDGSGLVPMGISPWFGLVPGEWRGYNTGDIRNSIANGSPVIINGSQHLSCVLYCWGTGKAHEWIIDGMRDLGITTTYQVTTSYYGSAYCSSQASSSYTYNSFATTSTEIWQNWGLEGNGNGWVAQGVFKPIGYSEDYDFNHANYIIAYITPL